VKHWIPELRKYPAKYIYEPWKAPRELQRQWGCVVGERRSSGAEDSMAMYPSRVVVHEEVSKANIARMKEAYAAHREGRNPVPGEQAGADGGLDDWP